MLRRVGVADLVAIHGFGFRRLCWELGGECYGGVYGPFDDGAERGDSGWEMGSVDPDQCKLVAMLLKEM